tara:strand:- start:103 stop:492 length:390 start_codon:yes stop_codon:yes gene_type:complete
MTILSTVTRIRDQLLNNSLISGEELSVDISYRSVGNTGSYSNGSFAPSATTTTTLKAIKTPYTLEEINASSGMVKGTDLKFLIAPIDGIDFRAYKNDEIIFDGTTYQVIDVTMSNFGSTNFLVILHCRS